MPLYKRPNSPYWWADIRVPGRDRLRFSTDTDDRVQAQRIHDQRKAEVWATKPDRDAHTLSEAILMWCKADIRGEPDLLSIRKFMRAYKDRDVRAAAEDRDGIDKALRSFIRTPGNYTRYRNRLMAVFNLARREGWIDRTPDLREWRAVRTPPPNWLRPEQYLALLRELAPHQRPMVVFATQTGLRQSNVLGLTWDRVDLKNRLVWVDAIDAKANKTIRVPLNDTALSVLEGQVGEHDLFVFTYQGRAISEIKTSFQKACIRAGLAAEKKTPNPDNKRGFTRTYSGLRWHELRHTFASWHAQSGTPPQVIKELGGWSSMQMVERYMHLSPSFTASYANNITPKGKT
jgi:integrase